MNVPAQHVLAPFLSTESKLAKKILKKVPGCKGLTPFLMTKCLRLTPELQ
jgi:hypothetical protein